MRFGDQFQILSGLKAGDKISTSANFLIDSESRLQSGAGGMGGMAGMEGMDMGGPKETDPSNQEQMKQPNDGKSTEPDHSQMQHKH